MDFVFASFRVFREGDTADNYPVSGDFPPKNAHFFPARVFTGIDLPSSNIEDRGKLLVIVDGDVASAISSSLGTYTNDLIGDGWSVVLKTDAPRHEGTLTNCTSGIQSTEPVADATNKTNRENLKDWIVTNHSDATGIVLVGHVTVPFSDVQQGEPDGHGDHSGAWVADLWYGDTAGTFSWSDTYTNSDNCIATPQLLMRFPHTHNVPGNGKFDSPYGPTDLAMFVGRIDFARISTFGTEDDVTSAETDLLAQYFSKNHAYRTKSI